MCNLQSYIFCQNLKTKINKKEDYLINLKITGLKTIQSFPDDCIHVYTDGSAMKGTVNAGYVAKIYYPEEISEEIYIPC